MTEFKAMVLDLKPILDTKLISRIMSHEQAIADIRLNLACQYCKLPMVDPVKCAKGHVFCRQCAEYPGHGFKCPVESTDIVLGPILTPRMAIALACLPAILTLRCSIKDCKFSGCAQDLRTHIIRYCPHELVPCPFAFQLKRNPIPPLTTALCTHRMPISDLRAHLLTAHKMSPSDSPPPLRLLGHKYTILCADYNGWTIGLQAYPNPTATTTTTTKTATATTPMTFLAKVIDRYGSQMVSRRPWVTDLTFHIDIKNLSL